VASNIVLHQNSLYGDVKVWDMGDARFLLLDGVTHGAVSRSSGEPLADYLFFLETIALMRPEGRKALLIGLGAGILPESFRKYHGIDTDVVEIDPAVARAAQGYFGFKPTGAVAVQDGRMFVERARGTYDFVILDAFTSERAPFHLFTQEFFRKAKGLMNPGGLFAVNIICDPSRTPWHSIYKTLKTSFPHVRAFATEVPEGAIANMVLVAGEGDIPLPGTQGVRAAFRPVVEGLAAREAPLPSEEQLAEARVLTDDFNPIDDLFRPVMVKWRTHIIETTGGVLLFDEE
jgi:spermidine synthase